MPEDLIAGQRIAWRHWDRGAGRHTLAIHCSLAHAGAWAGLAEMLPEISLTAMDQPGHGRSEDWRPGSDLHALTTAAATVLAQRLAASGPVDLFGHSFGATVCLRLALERPDLIRSLVLVEPVLFAAARGTPVFAEFARAQADLPTATPEDRLASASRFHALWGDGRPLASLPERQMRYILDRIHIIPAQNRVLLDDAAGLLRPGGLEALSRPVLLVEGGESPAVIPAIQAALAARLPQARRVVLDGAGHMAPITHPGPLADAIRRHLQES
ncbi:alpha/beta fold hydrolase [Xinfangfangia pollutisoli]|uniref:alpha/beta fold hydrolase n=1 Tax=Xinfangfangia pollutisoli TaxID=2865960 RepID=UPI001CD3A948|nr:alpha/beta hydrolase [Xinfangfangia pollutisoli]